MLLKFKASRKLPSKYVGQLQKNSQDIFIVCIDYQNELTNIDYPVDCVVTAQKISDESDVTDDLVDELFSENIVQGTATGGSNTTLISSNLQYSDIGDSIVNITKNQVMIVKSVTKTSVPNDTITFDTQSVSVESADQWTAQYVATILQGVEDG